MINYFFVYKHFKFLFLESLLDLEFIGCNMTLDPFEHEIKCESKNDFTFEKVNFQSKKESAGKQITNNKGESKKQPTKRKADQMSSEEGIHRFFVLFYLLI